MMIFSLPVFLLAITNTTGDEEYYYIVSGEGTMTLDGESMKVTGGDITAVYPGGMHALENTGTEDLRIIVISVRIG
jgi:mannose-6-phosphate isomerase-like protein (cupin superfamily)